VLVFPGLFRGALDSRAKNITKEMKLACSYAIASLIPENELNEENIISRALDKKVSMVVAEAVKKAAK
jgi:malate dehydrogenase (oxaloacetate-decarboxylating)